MRLHRKRSKECEERLIRQSENDYTEQRIAGSLRSSVGKDALI